MNETVQVAQVAGTVPAPVASVALLSASEEALQLASFAAVRRIKAPSPRSDALLQKGPPPPPDQRDPFLTENEDPRPVSHIPAAWANGRYVRKGLLAKGGQGVLALALDTVSGALVAVKALFWTTRDLRDPAAASRRNLAAQRRTAGILASIARTTSGVPVLIDLFQQPSPTLIAADKPVKTIDECFETFLVMRFYGRGGSDRQEAAATLGSVLAGGKRLSAEMTLEVGAQLAATLAGMQRRLVASKAKRRMVNTYWVHGDLKPANILVLPAVPQFLIIDFDSAKRVEDTGRRVGPMTITPGYAPPTWTLTGTEWADREPLSARWDIHCLGATLFECATGENPRWAVEQLQDPRPGRAEVLAKVRAATGAPMLARIIVDAMTPDPEFRIGSADALARELGRARRAHDSRAAWKAADG